jgi:hypothetical protein
MLNQYLDNNNFKHFDYTHFWICNFKYIRQE